MNTVFRERKLAVFSTEEKLNRELIDMSTSASMLEEEMFKTDYTSTWGMFHALNKRSPQSVTEIMAASALESSWC